MVPGSTLYFCHLTSADRTESYGPLPSARKHSFTSSYSEISPVSFWFFWGGWRKGFYLKLILFSKSSREQHFNSWNIHNHLSMVVTLEVKFGWIENQLLMFSILEYLKYSTSWIFLQSTNFSNLLKFQFMFSFLSYSIKHFFLLCFKIIVRSFHLFCRLLGTCFHCWDINLFFIFSLKIFA